MPLGFPRNSDQRCAEEDDDAVKYLPGLLRAQRLQGESLLMFRALHSGLLERHASPQVGATLAGPGLLRKPGGACRKGFGPFANPSLLFGQQWGNFGRKHIWMPRKGLERVVTSQLPAFLVGTDCLASGPVMGYGTETALGDLRVDLDRGGHSRDSSQWHSVPWPPLGSSA